MIKNITPGTGIHINHNHSSWPSFYNTAATTGNTLIGQLRYNGSTQSIEVYDGSVWLTIPNTYPTIELTGDAQMILNWARTKMLEESRIKELADKHPSVADALAAVDKAEEQVCIMVALADTQ